MRRRSIVPFLWLILSGLACDGPKSADSSQRVRLGVGRPGISEVEAPATDRQVAGQLVYVPAYSHVLTADNRQPLNLAATLFIRNIDPARSLIITGVDYFDSGGKRVREFLTRPLKVEALASMDFFVEESDVTGGGSPSFLVRWVAVEKVNDPIVESVMIGTSGTQGISFVGTGRIVNPLKP